MLSETETHYLVGFLYLHTQRTDVTVETSAILGAKVRDEAAEKTRDVDIVVAIAGETALIGVEVKDEARPLDVITVEQVCVKLKDMPTLRGTLSRLYVRVYRSCSEEGKSARSWLPSLGAR